MISATIDELKEKGYIDPTGKTLDITDKAIAYSEQYKKLQKEKSTMAATSAHQLQHATKVSNLLHY